MRKRDNDFVDSIIVLADEHFGRVDGLDSLGSAVAARLAEAEKDALLSGNGLNRADSRWAIRKALYQPDSWPGLDPRKRSFRHAALGILLGLCKA